VGNKEQMFQVECLHGREDATWPALFLHDPVFDLLVEVESLVPGVMEVGCGRFEQQFLDVVALLGSYWFNFRLHFELVLGLHGDVRSRAVGVDGL